MRENLETIRILKGSVSMHIRGALHIHSTLSRDGTMTIAELARWYRQKGFQFLAMGEHAEDLNEEKAQTLSEQAIESSNDQFCVIPGMEFKANGNLHILGIGVTRLIPEKDPVSLIDGIHKQGGMAVLAHPTPIGRDCTPDALRALDAVEIWNVAHDGKYLPSAQGINRFINMRRVSPNLLAVASQDFHQPGSFYDVAIDIKSGSLSPGKILENLRQARYEIRSRFFRASPKPYFSRETLAALGLLAKLLANLRKARSILRRRSSGQVLDDQSWRSRAREDVHAQESSS